MAFAFNQPGLSPSSTELQLRSYQCKPISQNKSYEHEAPRFVPKGLSIHHTISTKTKTNQAELPDSEQIKTLWVRSEL
jgi:hypothetical protein